MARNLSRVRRWADRRRIAATTGLLALLLQFCASLVPASAMADMALAEIDRLPLCTVGPGDSGGPANQPAKSDHRNQLDHRCQICQTLQLLGASVAPTETVSAYPIPANDGVARPTIDRLAATLRATGFLSRAPPRIA